MSGGYYLAWTLPDGRRDHNPQPRDRELTEAMRDMGNRTSSIVYAALSAAELETWAVALETWKEQSMDGATETWADAEAMMTNADGDPVPARLVPGRIKLEDQTVRILIKNAKAMQAAMSAFKIAAFSDIYAYLDELAAIYGTKRAGKRGGVQLNAYDGLSKVEISVADSMTFGPELEAARLLINECIESWTQTADAKVKVLVNDAFRVGKTGTIRVDRVLGLRRLEIDDDRWRMAMVAVADAIRTQGSVSYIRFYTRPSQDVAWQHVPLDMSRL